MRNRRAYTSREDHVIRTAYVSVDRVADLSERLGRSVESIYYRAKRIGAPLKYDKGKIGSKRLFDGRAPRGVVTNQYKSKDIESE